MSAGSFFQPAAGKRAYPHPTLRYTLLYVTLSYITLRYLDYLTLHYIDWHLLSRALTL